MAGIYLTDVILYIPGKTKRDIRLVKMFLKFPERNAVFNLRKFSFCRHFEYLVNLVVTEKLNLNWKQLAPLISVYKTSRVLLRMCLRSNSEAAVDKFFPVDRIEKTLVKIRCQQCCIDRGAEIAPIRQYMRRQTKAEQCLEVETIRKREISNSALR